MSERTARWLVKLGLVVFIASMVLPTRSDSPNRVLGYLIAMESLSGSLMGIKVCLLGLAGNVLFIITAVLLLVRLVRGRPRPSFRLVFYMTLPTFAAMAGSWAWLQWMWVHSGETHSWMTPGPVAWVGSAMVLAVGCWRLRDVDAKKLARGLEVVPVKR